MQKLALIAVIVAASCALPARADPVTVSGSGTFAAFPGYGYQYTASWDASLGEFTFLPSANSVLNLSGQLQGALVSVSGLFSKTGSQVVDAEAFDLLANVQLRFINTATGQPALPPQVSTPNARFRGSRTENYSVLTVPSELRFSTSIENTAMTFRNGVGQNLNTGTPLPSTPGNLELNFQLSVHFEAGNVLQASPDPNCASFACMVPAHDKLTAGNTGFLFEVFTGSLVPEPGIGMLLAAGVGGTLLAVRRRSDRRRHCAPSL